MNRQVVLAFALLSLAASRPQPAVEPATLVLKGGKIVTVDAARPEAQAMAIRGDRIAALGTNEEIQAYVGPATSVIDLAGQTAIPGLIEGHGHFAGMGRARMNLKLAGARNFEAVVAMENGVQLAVHCIGDRANREVLDVYEAAFKANPDKKDLRWRIEHAQHISAADIPRFGQLGVIASMQGVHATSDAPYVLARLRSQRAEEGAYVWQKLMKTGAIVSNGTDAPVEAIDPLPNFHALVTRRTADGSVFYGDQRMSRAEALKAYTYDAAYAAREEQIKGSLAPGKLADVTVLSKDIMTVPEEEITTAEVTYTIIGGKVAYRR